MSRIKTSFIVLLFITIVNNGTAQLPLKNIRYDCTHLYKWLPDLENLEIISLKNTGFLRFSQESLQLEDTPPNIINIYGPNTEKLAVYLLIIAFMFYMRKGKGWVLMALLLPTAQGVSNLLAINNRDIKVLSNDYLTNKTSEEQWQTTTEIQLKNDNLLIIYIDAFINFDYLTHLNLAHNQLTSLDVVVNNLKYLDLSYNQFQSIDGIFFRKYPTLQTLKLIGNDLLQVHLHLKAPSMVNFLDFSKNAELAEVTIQSSTLITLSLADTKAMSLQLTMPNLETLDLRGTNTNPTQIEDLCTFRFNNTSIVYSRDGISKRLMCRDLLRAGADDLMDQMPRSNRAAFEFDAPLDLQPQETTQVELKMPQQRERSVVGCKFSTRHANPEDIILTPEELKSLQFDILILVSIIGVLVVLVIFFALKWVGTNGSSKPMKNQQLICRP